MNKQYPPYLLTFTELLREWMVLDSKSQDREQAERHWQLEQEINKRAPKEDFE